MPGINAALSSSGNDIAALERSLDAIQQNVGNASTPGYARQDLVGAIGNPSDAVLQQTQDSRDQFAETAVQQQNSLLGYYDQLSSTLQSVQANFPSSADSGIPNAIDNLFSSFSALTTSPNDATARQQVIDQAGQVAQAFNSTAASLTSQEGTTRQQISSEVDTINQLAGLVQQYNQSGQGNATPKDPIADAKLYDTLEQLSAYGNIQAIPQSDGSITLLLGGQTALVVGQTQFPITADVTSGPTAAILDSHGNDVTSNITGGQLGGSLQALNQSIPSYLSGLDQLAQGVADSVNATLSGGVDENGAPGTALFTYDSPTDAAATLAVTGITTDQIAAASASAPGGNGNALALSALGAAQSLNGYTYAGFYGNVASQVGQDVSNATSGQTEQTQLLAQARAQRTAISGVSLDDEAVQLVQYQSAYEATAKVVNILDQLSADTINMVVTT